jgi:mannonate dehydratase
MQMTFRWYGATDAVALAKIKQIPGVTGIVSALYDVPVGEVWPLARLRQLKDEIENAGLQLGVIESIPVHEDIKLGRPGRDGFIDNYCRSIQNMGSLGIPVLCYNFMPVFDWTRTNLALRLADGSTALSYDHADLTRIDLSKGTGELPGWATAYSAAELNRLFSAYKEISEEQLWDNLRYFLEKVVPVAAASNVVMGIHPDDPPWPIFGLPRIIVNEKALQRVLDLVDHPANGLTFCAGSLGADPANDLPAMIRRFGAAGRIHFAHCRNIKITGDKEFHESPHPSAHGDVDMFEVMKAYHEIGFRGPMRPDHGRMIWGETGRPGYGLYDRALGAMYLCGLWEALEKGNERR